MKLTGQQLGTFWCIDPQMKVFIAHQRETAETINQLHSMGLVNIEWQTKYDFIATLTDEGRALMQEPLYKPDWKRTRRDYLIIARDQPGYSFGEYDNIHIIVQMIKDKVLIQDPERRSTHTSMYTSVYVLITDKGRAELALHDALMGTKGGAE